MPEIFEYRRQARGPYNYLCLGLSMTTMYMGHIQGWGVAAILLSMPLLVLVVERLIRNPAEGFRLDDEGLHFYDETRSGDVDRAELLGVTVSETGRRKTLCLLHLSRHRTIVLPATGAFRADRLSEVFRMHGVPIWQRFDAHSLMVEA